MGYEKKSMRSSGRKCTIPKCSPIADDVATSMQRDGRHGRCDAHAVGNAGPHGRACICLQLYNSDSSSKAVCSVIFKYRMLMDVHAMPHWGLVHGLS